LGLFRPVMGLFYLYLYLLSLKATSNSFCMSTPQHLLRCLICCANSCLVLMHSIFLSYLTKGLRRTVSVNPLDCKCCAHFAEHSFILAKCSEHVLSYAFIFTFSDIWLEVRLGWRKICDHLRQLAFRFCYCSCLFVVLSIPNQTICLQQNLLLCIPPPSEMFTLTCWNQNNCPLVWQVLPSEVFVRVLLSDYTFRYRTWS